MSPPDWPAPTELLEHHGRLLTGLRLLGSQHHIVSVDPASKFFGLTREEFDVLMQSSAEELDRWAVMMLAASCEGLFRHDLKERKRDRRLRNDLVTRALRELPGSSTDHERLDDIFETWRDATQAKKLFHDLGKVMLRRHWLAHGRHWSDKSGVPPDPLLVANLIGAVIQAVQRHAPDFPRL